VSLRVVSRKRAIARGLRGADMGRSRLRPYTDNAERESFEGDVMCRG